jgi:diphosphomevalonate decarboxylase
MSLDNKATARAPTNIAFIKYMGKDARGDGLPGGQGKNFPENGSVSMTLDNLYSTTTVHFSPNYQEDIFVLDGVTDPKESQRVFAVVDLIRTMSSMSMKAKIVSENNFGKSRGLSSSASAAAALVTATSSAAGLKLDERDLSILARKFSGSGSRSIPGGWVEWKAPTFAVDGSFLTDSYAESFLPHDHWQIADVVAVTSVPAKEVSTTEAHGKVHESIYRLPRLAAMPKKIDDCKRYIFDRDFTNLGKLAEQEAWDLHILFISSGIRYIRSETLRIMENIEQWRRGGLEAYYTLNTGQDVHILCEEKNIHEVQSRLESLLGVTDVIVNRPGKGTHLIDAHLF